MEIIASILSVINIGTRSTVAFLLAYSIKRLPALSFWQRVAAAAGAIAAVTMTSGYVVILFQPVDRLVFRAAAPFVALGCIVVIWHTIKKNRQLAKALRQIRTRLDQENR